MPARVFRLTGLALTSLFALAVLASGFDRISEYRPEFAEAVPAPFSVNAAREIARRSLAAKGLDEATAQAIRAVRNDPSDAWSLGLLGSTRLVSGDEAGAERAFTVSAAMGWREPATQLYWMAAALNLGDFEIASQRLDALLRQSPSFAGSQQWLNLFEASADGRSALARRLADNPAWGPTYFADGSTAGLTGRTQVAEALPPREGTCATVAPTMTQLIAVGQFAAGHRVWRRHCQSARDTGNLADGGFSSANLVKPRTPFDWTWPDDGAIGLELTPAPGFTGRTLAIITAAPQERAFATQIIVLPPGAYRASWRVLDAAAAPAAGLRLSLACAPTERRPLDAQLSDAKAGRFAADFVVPAGCPAQWLTFSIKPGSEPATLDDVAIVPR